MSEDLLVALRESRLGDVKQWLSSGGDVNAKIWIDNSTPKCALAFAFYYRSSDECISLLIERGATLDHDVLYHACRACRVSSIDILIESANPDIVASFINRKVVHHYQAIERHETLVHYLSHYINTSLLQWALDHGGDANARDTRGYTPAHVIVSEHVGVGAWTLSKLKILQSAGADLFAVTDAGDTTLSLFLQTSPDLDYTKIRKIVALLTPGGSATKPAAPRKK